MWESRAEEVKSLKPLRFATNAFNVIDFLAVFPGYLSLLGFLLRDDEHSSSFHLNKA